MTARIPPPDEYTLRLVDLPVRQGGMISEDPEGHVSIYINARLSDAGRREAAKHEFDHWANDDLHNDQSIQDVEREGAEGRPSKLPKLMRARDLLRRRYAPTPADDWKNDVYLKLYDYRDI